MKILLNILLALTILLSPTTLFAQEAPQTLDSSLDLPLEATTTSTFTPFDVVVYTDGQSAWNKKVPVFIEFTPSIDSDKVQIDWDLPSGVTVDPAYKEFFPVVKGMPYRIKAYLEPVNTGTYNIGVNVIAWQYNTNYTSSGELLITFDENLLTVPLSPTYTVGVIVKWLTILGVFAVAGYFGYIYAIKSKKRFMKWFSLPD